MKTKFSKNWKSSKQPRKQRKYLANAPLHIRKNFMNANISKELRQKYKKKRLRLKKGDSVKVMRGKFKGKTGKILEVYTNELKVTVEGIQTTKRDGSKANIKMQPSNLQIKETSERSEPETSQSKSKGEEK